jgi:hypothetical protein
VLVVLVGAPLLLFLPGPTATAGRAGSTQPGMALAQVALVGPQDVGGLSERPAGAGSWLAPLPAGARRGVFGVARVLRAQQTPELTIVTRAAVAPSAGAARTLFRAARGLSAASLNRADAAVLGVGAGSLGRAVRRTWQRGRVVGELTYLDPTGQWGQGLLGDLLRSVEARVARLGPVTVGEGILERASRGPVDVHTALEAFVLEFGPVPGVKVASGPVGALPSRSAVLAWVAADSRRLSGSQRAAVTKVLGRLFGTSPGHRVLSALGSTGTRTASCAEPWTETSRVPAGPPIDEQDCTVLREATAYFRAKLGLSGPGLRQVLVPEPTPAANFGEEGSTPPPLGALGFPSYCKTYLAPSIRAGSFVDRAYVIAHETFHCLMFQKVGFFPYKWAPLWVGEGGAVFAGCQFMQDKGLGVPPTAVAHYLYYVQSPDKPLDVVGDGGYAGIGFFALLRHVGVDPFSRIPLMFAVGYSNELSYRAGVAGAESKVLDDWAAGYFGDDRGGDGDWKPDDPCAPKQVGPPRPLIVTQGARETIDVPAFANVPYALDSRAPIVHVRVERGNIRISGRNGVDDKRVADAYYCTSAAGCACRGQAEKALLPSSQPFLAATGGRDGVRATVEGLACPMITHATYTVRGATFAWTVSGCMSRATLDWTVHWDPKSPLPLRVGAKASVFPAGDGSSTGNGTVSGGGTYTRSDCGPLVPACSTSLTVVPRSATPTIAIEGQQGTGRDASWTVSVSMVAEGNIAFFPQGACTPVPFEDFPPAEEDLQTVSHVTLKPTGTATEHTESFSAFPFASTVGGGDASVDQQWSGQVTVTGTF